jgi:cytochrome c2
MRVDNVS